MHAKRGLSLMSKLVLEKKYEFEAEEYLYGVAELQFKENIIGSSECASKGEKK